MNLPNLLTLSRILLTFIFMALLSLPGIVSKLLTIFVFILASLTDYWDGYLARKKNLITNFGKIMDTVADKILVLAAFLSFVEMKLMPSWMAIIIIARELLITGIRLISLVNGTVIPAMRAGKHKTLSQFFAIFITLIALTIREIMSEKKLWNISYERIFYKIVFCSFFIATLFTLTSGINFLYSHRHIWQRKEF